MLDTLRQSGRLMLSRLVTQLIQSNTIPLIVRRMLVFSATLAYSGLHLSLWSGVFATAVGFTAGFGENRLHHMTASTVTTSKLQEIVRHVVLRPHLYRRGAALHISMQQ